MLRNKAQKEHSLGVPTLWKKLFSVLYFNVHVKNKYAGASAFAAFKSETGLDFFLSDQIARKNKNLLKGPIQNLGCFSKNNIFLCFANNKVFMGLINCSVCPSCLWSETVKVILKDGNTMIFLQMTQKYLPRELARYYFTLCNYLCANELCYLLSFN